MAETTADDDRDEISYNFSMDADPWDEWVETIPRKISIEQELRSVIRRQTTDQDGSAEVGAVRIRRHAMRATQAVSRGDSEEAKAELKEITKITESIA